MSGAEMWRVVLADGGVIDVPVECIGEDSYLARFRQLAAWAGTPRRAVLRLAGDCMGDAVEILAPGEPTRAELLAQLAADDPAKDDTDEAHPAWRRGYNAGESYRNDLVNGWEIAQAEARTARARVALFEAERNEARAKQHAAEAEVARLRAENDVLRKSTDAAVDGVRDHAAEVCDAFAADSQRELEEHGDGEYGTAQWIQGRISGAGACADLIRALMTAKAEVKP